MRAERSPLVIWQEQELEKESILLLIPAPSLPGYWQTGTVTTDSVEQDRREAIAQNNIFRGSLGGHKISPPANLEFSQTLVLWSFHPSQRNKMSNLWKTLFCTCERQKL